jgi:hypothetical protein
MVLGVGLAKVGGTIAAVGKTPLDLQGYDGNGVIDA